MKRKGFTLIELLAVIIILGILMLVAIPSVTGYINNSRKETYVSTIKELIRGASNLVNDGSLDIYDKDTTYYIPASAIKLESGKAQSPYGEIDEAYVVVTYDGEKFEYYYVGKDENDQGIETLTKEELINKDLIKSDVDDIDTTVGVRGKENIVVFDNNLNQGDSTLATKFITPSNKNNYVCKRATTLHSRKCYLTSEGCYKMGYYEGGSQGIDTVTFGNLGESGYWPETGDAYDCDVNADGKYDDKTERFYYISDYYNTDTRTFDSKKGVLIFYKNYSTDYAYDSNYENWHGPVSLYEHLPSTTEWDNKYIIPVNERRILTDIDTEYTNPGNNQIENPFNYNNKAARLITIQELREGCGEITINDIDALDNCLFLFESTTFTQNSNNNGYGYWLENPYNNKNNDSLGLLGQYRKIGLIKSYSTAYGIRPVITVLKDNIEF